jgi:hypothetical protein
MKILASKLIGKMQPAPSADADVTESTIATSTTLGFEATFAVARLMITFPPKESKIFKI